MRRIDRLGRALVGALIAAVLTASPALALESTWLVNGAAPSGEVTMSGESVGRLRFEDMGVPGAMECEVAGKGTVGPGRFGLVTSITMSSCIVPAKAENIKGELVTNACTSEDSVSLLNLPWLSEVALSGGAFIAVITSGGSGEPGYLVECATLLGLVDDTCTNPHNEGTLTNHGEGEVRGEIVTTEPGNCTIGGKSVALLEGTGLFFSPEGATLAVSEG